MGCSISGGVPTLAASCAVPAMGSVLVVPRCSAQVFLLVHQLELTCHAAHATPALLSCGITICSILLCFSLSEHWLRTELLRGHSP